MVNNMEQQQQQHGNRSQCIFWRSRQLLTDIFKGSSDLRIKLILINSLPLSNQYSFKSFALTFFNLLCRSRQGVGWDRGARIQLRWVHFGVDTFWENLYFLEIFWISLSSRSKAVSLSSQAWSTSSWGASLRPAIRTKKMRSARIEEKCWNDLLL